MVKEAITILVSFGVGYAIDHFWAKIQKNIPSKNKGQAYAKVIVKRIRFHHNIFGYILILAGFFYWPLILVPAGIGMIVGHRIRDELFWFIEGVDKDVEKLKKQAKRDNKALRKNQIRLKRKIQNDIKEFKKTFK